MKNSLKFGLIFVLALLGTFAQAQNMTPPVLGAEYWNKDNLAGCENASPGEFVYYSPRTRSSAPLKKDQFVGGLSTEYCVLMPLPEVKEKEVWVRQQTGAPFIFDKDAPTTPIARSECHNPALKMIRIASPTPIGDRVRNIKGDKGEKGDQGIQGLPGTPGKNAEVVAPKSHKKAILFAVGGAVGGGVVYALTHKNKHYLNGTTKDVTKCATTSGKFTCK